MSTNSVQQLQGARRHFGPREVEREVPSKTNTNGVVEQIIVEFDFDCLNQADAGGAAGDNLRLDIPADAYIKSSVLFVTEAFVGGTSIEIGSEADADGLDTVAVADLVEDAVIVNDGALVGAAWDSSPSTVELSATGTFTAGKGRLVVEYIPTR